MATQVFTTSETRYITKIDAVDANTDSLTISTVAPGGTPPTGSMFAETYAFPVAKPHSYVTGGELTFTRTVGTTS